MNPLYCCIAWNSLPAARLLLEAGADPNSSPFWKTLLHHVLEMSTKMHEKQKMLELLLAFGANPRLPNAQGILPAYVAPTPEIKKILTDATKEKK